MKFFNVQSVTIQQDSQNELQRAFQSKIQQPARHYSSVLLEQEKQRNMEKQKEELGNLHKLQAQHQDEQRRWEKEREQQSIQIKSLEAQLKQREEACKTWEEMLHEENAELEKQKEEHQQNLERLRESVKSVEREEERLAKERERLEKQKLVKSLHSDHQPWSYTSEKLDSNVFCYVFYWSVRPFFGLHFLSDKQ